MKIALVCAAATLALSCSGAAFGRVPSPNPYATMAPLAKYLIRDRKAEIALARSGGPSSISDRAEVLVLTKRGYVVAVKGTNGWVCAVERSWMAGFDDPEFWNWRARGPACFNPPAVRSVLPQYLTITQWVLSGATREAIAAKAKTDYADHRFADPASGSFAFMLSKEQYLLGADGPWRPHIMPFVAYDQVRTWAAGVKGSPILAPPPSAGFRPYQPVTLAIPVAHWSDGSSAPKS